MESNVDLDKRAAEELLREAKRAAARASIGGALAWQKCPLPPTNKQFLQNTVCSVLITNKLREKKQQETTQKQKPENRKLPRTPERNRNVSRNQKSEPTELKTMTQFKHKYSEKKKEHKGEFKRTVSRETNNKKPNK